jgi:hypothetical protein
VRSGARSVLKWFSGLFVVLIVIQVFLAGEGIFRMNTIIHSDDCNKAHAVPCPGNSKTLDVHRFLGFILTQPGALLFLIVALVAWHPNMRVRVISIVVPILTFVQLILAVIGKWVGGLHPVNAILILGMYGWLFYTLRREGSSAPAPAPVTSG